MNRRNFLHRLGLSVPLLATLPKAMAKQKSDLPRVLLLGDSISIGYWPFVVEMMQGEAAIFRPMKADGSPENCEGTTLGLKRLDSWLGQTQWDLIHFNFGLHDLKHVDPETRENSKNLKDPRQAEPRQYRQNLKQITGRLKNSGAKLIFATTTPYPAELSGPLREFGDDIRYNRIAHKIMKKNDIPVNDLYEFVKPKMAELQRPNNVHFTPQGSKALAERVCMVIRRQL